MVSDEEEDGQEGTVLPVPSPRCAWLRRSHVVSDEEEEGQEGTADAVKVYG